MTSSYFAWTALRLRMTNDPEYSNQPRRIDQSHVGDQGEHWFAAALPLGWKWQPPLRDVGKDGLIVIRDGSGLHNLEFSVQIKAFQRPLLRDGAIVLGGIKRSAIQYWFASPLPTLVIAVDIVNRVGWYIWHLDLFDSPNEVFGVETKTMTIRIPQTNQLNEAGWQSIRKDIHQHFSALQRAIGNDAVMSHLFVTVHNIARIVGNLIRLGSSAPPEPPITQSEGIALLLEQMELRGAIDFVRSLMRRIANGTDAHKQIDFWLTSFEKVAVTAHPSLRDLPPYGQAIPVDLQLAFAPKEMIAARPRLITAAVDLIRLLTSPHPPADSAQGDANDEDAGVRHRPN